MRNLTLQLRGLPEVYYDLVREFLNSYIQCLDPICFSFAHLIEDFDDDGSASIIVVLGSSDSYDEDFEGDIYD